MHPSTLEQAVRNIPDFPRPGIQFKDITPVLGNARLFAASIDRLVGSHAPHSIDAVAGIDARGFIFATAVALRLDAAFVPIRKKGKLPYTTLEESYDLEYGSNTLAIHTDAVEPNARVLLVDDLLATGGTALAAARLLQRLGARLIEAVFLIELTSLRGRGKLDLCPVRTVLQY
jgi:adenine phosphoribosyltransferase